VTGIVWCACFINSEKDDRQVSNCVDKTNLYFRRELTHSRKVGWECMPSMADCKLAEVPAGTMYLRDAYL
jgi:hypothetical protein